MYNIRLLNTDELFTILPFLQMLNENMSVAILENRLKEMAASNYRCVGIYDADKLIGISGLWLLTKHYVGKHIEPDNVIIHPDYRNKKIGEQLFQWIYNYAREQGCVASELNCYVQNHQGVRFWISQGYRIIGYHMQKLL